MSENDKIALLNKTATVPSTIEILPANSDEEAIVLTENTGIVSWDHEDFRYVANEGFIGQFVARKITGKVKRLSTDIDLLNREIKVSFGIKKDTDTTWYSLGNFIVTKVTDDNVKDVINFDALDYTKKFNVVFNPENVAFPCTAKELAEAVCNQCGCIFATTAFRNESYIIDDNPFNNNETCRDVMKAIAQLAFSWVRVDWDNKVYMDFSVETETDQYDRITNHEYYSLETQQEYFGPVNRVVIGYKDIDGEQTKIEDADSINEFGVNEITIFNNPLVYTQAQRESIIQEASFLYGFKYMPMKAQTIGHPWLKGYELLDVIDMEGNLLHTIPFDRTLQYFGHIKSLIVSDATSKTDNEYAYPSKIDMKFLNVQYQVDKINGRITTEVMGAVNENAVQISRVVQDINNVQNLFQITGGNNLIKNSVGLFGNNYWEQSETGSFEYGEDDELVGKTTSRSKITISNGKLKTKQDNINGLTYSEVKTLSFKMKQDANTATTVRIYGLSSALPLFERTFTEEVDDWTDVFDGVDESGNRKPIQFYVDAPNLTLEIESTSEFDGKFYISDLMLNNGDKTEWQPASSEIWGTVIKLSQLGVSVYSVEGQFITLMDSTGFGVYECNGEIIGRRITSFNRNGIITTSVEMEGILKQYHIIHNKLKYNGLDTYVEYIEG